MTVKSRIIELNNKIHSWLNKRGIVTTENETSTSLVKKVEAVPLVFNQMSLMPTSNNTTAPALNDEINNMYSTKGCWFPEQTTGKSFGFYSVVPTEEYPKAWPHVTTTYNTTAQVPNLKLFIDASHSNEFNMCVWWKDPDEEYSRGAWLDDIMEMGDQLVDFPAPRTTFMSDFGKYIIHQDQHAAAPVVANKVDLLKLATGKSKNYLFSPTAGDIGGQRSFGANGDANNFLIKDNFDLTKTPYLYYSIQQPETSGATFALYTNDTTVQSGETNSAWYLGRQVSQNETKPSMIKGGENYAGASGWMYGSQTGCINLLDYISSEKQTSFKIAELKLYGFGVDTVDQDTECVFNYLFLGSAPTNYIADDWGQPATIDKPLINEAARGGAIVIEKIDYYVVGGYEDWTRLNAVSIARPYNYS